MSFVHGSNPSATMFAPSAPDSPGGAAGAPRAMDDLDRLAFRLIRIIRQRYPQLQTYGFTLTDLEGTLIPFREARREMANGGADTWERMVLRLVAGERDYLLTDAELQRACKQALLMPSPTVGLVRAWATSTIRLGAASHAFSPSTPASSAPPTAAPETAHSTVIAADAVTMRGSPAESQCPASDCCRYCGNRLPTAGSPTFCPHCGLDLSKRQCPACSTQLEFAWRFCVTCGRQSDPPADAGIPRPAGAP